MDVPILFSLNSNEFQALMQELKSQQVIITAFMEEMKQESQSSLENLRERGQPRQEVASKPKMQFSANLRGASEFHRLPMEAKVRYFPPHVREGGILENVAGERPNAARTTAPQRIFPQTNPIIHPGVYEEAFLSMEARGASCSHVHE